MALVSPTQWAGIVVRHGALGGLIINKTTQIADILHQASSFLPWWSGAIKRPISLPAGPRIEGSRQPPEKSGDRLKVTGRPAADWADEIRGQGVTLIDKAADLTYKACLLYTSDAADE